MVKETNYKLGTGNPSMTYDFLRERWGEGLEPVFSNKGIEWFEIKNGTNFKCDFDEWFKNLPYNYKQFVLNVPEKENIK